VGGYYGGRLAAAGADVSFVARGEHLKALQSDGLRLESPHGNLHLARVRATDDARTIGPVDLVLFTVKLYDTEGAIAQLPPLLGPATLVATLQNGVDSVERLRRALGVDRVVGGTTYITAVVAAPGVIRHTALHRLIVGMPDGRTAPLLDELQALCAAAGIDGTVSPHIEREIWTKFVRLSVFSGLTGVARCPIGAVLADPALADLLDRALAESMAVAAACGIALDARVPAKAREGFAQLPYDAKSSMLEDLQRGRRLELPWLSGTVVRIGRELGVATPVHEFITAALMPHVHGSATRREPPA
jgi:2-dehydropantoate 2-reductase